MIEIWMDIKGFKNKYQVSNLGRVRSLDTINEYINHKGNTVRRKKKGKILSPSSNGNGYLNVSLGRIRSEYIHRLVAETFIPNPENKPSVNHKDGNVSNNEVSNLEWLTYSENQYHAKNSGLTPLGERHPQAKLTDEQVEFIKWNYEAHHPLFSAKPLGERFGVANSIVCRIANGTKRVRK